MMKFHLFLFLLVGIFQTAQATNEVGPGESLTGSTTGLVSLIDRRHLGNPIVRIDAHGSYLPSPYKCMTGEIVEEISVNENRSTFDSPAKVAVDNTNVWVTFVHNTPFQKKLTLTNEAFNPVDEDCYSNAYLKSVTIAPTYYLSLILSFKRPPGSTISAEEWNQQLQARIAADPFFSNIRLREFADSAYIETVRSTAAAHAVDLGLIADGWFDDKSLFGANQITPSMTKCESGFHPSNPGRDHCLALAEMVASADDLYPEAEAVNYTENGVEATLMSFSYVLGGTMSAGVMPPHP